MRKLALIAITLALIASSRSLADEGYPQPVQVVAGILGLSEQQVGSWLMILHAREEALQPVRQQLQMRQETIGRLLQTPNPDPQLLGQLLLESRNIQQQAAAITSEAAKQFDQLLTSEQHDRLQQIRAAAQVCPAVPAFEAAGVL